MRANVIRAGELRSFVTFYIRPSEDTQDSTGFVQQLNSATELTTWETRAADVPAYIEANRGLEEVEGRKDIALLYETLTIRYDPDMIPVVTDAVVSDEDKRYEIMAVFDPDKRRQMLSISVRECT